MQFTATIIAFLVQVNAVKVRETDPENLVDIVEDLAEPADLFVHIDHQGEEQADFWLHVDKQFDAMQEEENYSDDDSHDDCDWDNDFEGCCYPRYGEEVCNGDNDSESDGAIQDD